MRAGLSVYNAAADVIIEKEGALVEIFFFLFLEIMPSSVLLYFHRHLPPSRSVAATGSFGSTPQHSVDAPVVNSDSGSGRVHGSSCSSGESSLRGRCSSEKTASSLTACCAPGLRGPSVLLQAQAAAGERRDAELNEPLLPPV